MYSEHFDKTCQAVRIGMELKHLSLIALLIYKE